ncbi:MAG: translocation/assembly module TamB domain-containing protein [Cyclobacteriaceae bacterium]
MQNKNSFFGHIKKWTYKIIKILAGTVLVVFILSLILTLLLQLPPVQNRLIQYAESYLIEKLDVHVSIGYINLRFFKNLELRDIYIEDQQADTLLYAGKFGAGINLTPLLRNEINLNHVLLEDATVNLKRMDGDTTFNFTFIPEAFAAENDTVPKEKDGKSWLISSTITEIIQSNVVFYDEGGGIDVSGKLGHVALSRLMIDTDNENYNANKFDLQNTQIVCRMLDGYIPKDTVIEESDPTALSIYLNGINMDAVRVIFDSPQIAIDHSFGKLRWENPSIDLGRQIVQAGSLNLIDNNLILQLASADEDGENVADSDEIIAADTANNLLPGFEWHIYAEILNAENFTASVSQRAYTTLPTHKPEKNLYNGTLNLDVKKIQLTADTAALDLAMLRIDLADSAQYITLSTGFYADNSELSLKKLNLNSLNSYIKDLNLKVNYQNPASLYELSEPIELALSIPEVYFAWADVFSFYPDADEYFEEKLLSGTGIGLNGELAGNLSQMNIDNITVDMGNGSYLALAGQFNNLSDMELMQFDARLEPLRITDTTVNKLAAKWLDTMQMRIPELTEINLLAQGSMNDLNAELDISSTIGHLAATGRYKSTAKHTYDSLIYNLKADSLKLGELLTLQNLQITSFESKGRLQMSDNNDVSGKIEYALEDIQYQKYTYQPLMGEAIFEKNTIKATAIIDDPNLQFAIDAEALMDSLLSTYDLSVDLQHADMYELYLSTKPMRVNGLLRSSATIKPLQEIDLEASFTDINVWRSLDRYYVDSASVFLTLADTISTGEISSDFISARLDANFHLQALPDLMKEHFKYYYGEDTSRNVRGKEHMELTIDFDEGLIISQELLPGLSNLAEASVKVKFDHNSHDLQFETLLREINYRQLEADSIFIRASSDNKEMRYRLGLKALQYDSVYLHSLTYGGLVRDNTIYQAFHIADSKDETKYWLIGNLERSDTLTKFSFLPDRVMLNYQKWEIAEDNYLAFSPSGIQLNNMDMRYSDQQISFDDEDNGLAIALKAFDIGNLFNLVELPAGRALTKGNMNGQVYLNLDEEASYFDVNLNVKDLEVKETLLGDFYMDVDNEAQDVLDVNLGLKGKNLFQLKGNYPMQDNPNPMDFELSIRSLDLADIEVFTFGMLDELEGTLTGNLKIGGLAATPDIQGKLTFQESSLRVADYSSTFKLKNESINFNNNEIVFDKFTIRDVAENPFTLNGNVTTTDFSFFKLDLNLTAENFSVIDSENDNDDEMLYGKLLLSTNTRITGNSDSPIIESRLNILDGTDLTIILPAEEMDLIDDANIVEYVDFDDNLNIDTLVNRAMRIQQADTLIQKLSGLDLSASLTIHQNAKFTLVIDPRSGDHVSIRGAASLNYNIDPNGLSNLVGTYEINRGNYQLSFYGLVKKEFTIASGSKVVWNGDPFQANASLTAIHTVRASPGDLIGAQGTNQPRLPFEVAIKINGPIMEPDVKFDLDLPESEKGRNPQVVNRLMWMRDPERESEMNKQVFALLVFGSFISDESGGSNPNTMSMATTAARNSVNGLLSEQLNRLSGRYIKGVDLNFQLQSFEEGEQAASNDTRTELSVDVSKSFLDDRLTVEVAGSFDIEGSEQQQRQNTTGLEPNIAVLYQLTEDGRYRLRAFRENIFDDFDGELFRTGIAFIFVRDFDSFGRPKKKNKSKENKEKQEKPEAQKPQEDEKENP